ncbi:proteasome assembly chaperone family protein [Microbacterium sp. C7(2022)]|uniref:proteasome assembly chaperone family protein n=1 Tax=Microbacterium sp. C7(2022) TaxID=2992759 RepID=UPI00237B79E4|nr:PAC2 family protein [Microbacterium sp. C7(2022)]MDE0545460.1 PAC2 family protein [Microbacterium sp. C7(2022)]
MPDPASIYERAVAAPPVPPGLPLVIALTGFADAGNAVSQTVDYLRDELDGNPLVRYVNDALLDYRARRPLVAFDGDRLTDYRAPRLELALVHDSLGQPFLLLSGYEPDFAWDAFARSVLEFTEQYGVSTVTWVHAIPMPVPHTRPLGTTVSGTRTELTEAHSVWKPHTQVPATAGHLLEYRLAEAGVMVAGFVLLVPHYLGDTEYPAAALAALDSLTVATGLVFAGDDLREANREYLVKVEEQVAGNDELSRMVAGLEERYDAYMAGSTQATAMIHTQDLPSADELAAELERFLATRPPGDDGKRGS